MKLILSILIFFLVLNLSALLISVPEDQPTIQAGINTAADGDTVLVQPGTYVENIDISLHNFYLISMFHYSSDPEDMQNTIIDGNQAGTVISVTDTEEAFVYISGFTITNGVSDEDVYYSSGGIYGSNSNLILNNLIISENIAETTGGGISLITSLAMIEDVSIVENSAAFGGGGISINGSDVTINNSKIEFNYSEARGGGISAINSSDLNITNSIIQDNISSSSGGGIFLSGTGMIVTDSDISNNSTGGWGGGINQSGSDIVFENARITNNSSGYIGGGIYSNASTMQFNEMSRSNVHSNSNTTRGFGADFYSINCNFTPVYLDTFTVINPSDYFVSPLHNFDLDVLNAISEPLIEANLYVAVDGSNTNSGLSPDAPLQTISYALSRINSDQNNIRTIYLAEGIYSNQTNGENLPILMSSYINIEGISPELTIIDGEEENKIIACNSVTNSSINNLSLINGYDYAGGAVTITNSAPFFKNVIFRNNSSYQYGGAIYCSNSSPVFVNITSVNNSSNHGATLFSNGSYPLFVNSILWENSPQEISINQYENPSEVTIAFSDISGGESAIETNSNGTVNWLYGNIEENPLFANPDMFDFQLSENSPCRDAGIASLIYQGELVVDLAEDEYFGTAPDMGALEFIVVENNEGVVEIAKTLITNYPNPFNPSTEIRFQIADVNKVDSADLEIYNIKGQKVKSFKIISFPEYIGTQDDKSVMSITWNGTDQNNNPVSSGLYFATLKSGDKILACRKMMLLK